MNFSRWRDWFEYSGLYTCLHGVYFNTSLQGFVGKHNETIKISTEANFGNVSGVGKKEVEKIREEYQMFMIRFLNGTIPFHNSTIMVPRPAPPSNNTDDRSHEGKMVLMPQSDGIPEYHIEPERIQEEMARMHSPSSVVRVRAGSNKVYFALPNYKYLDSDRKGLPGIEGEEEGGSVSGARVEETDAIKQEEKDKMMNKKEKKKKKKEAYVLYIPAGAYHEDRAIQGMVLMHRLIRAEMKLAMDEKMREGRGSVDENYTGEYMGGIAEGGLIKGENDRVGEEMSNGGLANVTDTSNNSTATSNATDSGMNNTTVSPPNSANPATGDDSANTNVPKVEPNREFVVLYGTGVDPRNVIVPLFTFLGLPSLRYLAVSEMDVDSSRTDIRISDPKFKSLFAALYTWGLVEYDRVMYLDSDLMLRLPNELIGLWDQCPSSVVSRPKKVVLGNANSLSSTWSPVSVCGIRSDKDDVDPYAVNRQLRKHINSGLMIIKPSLMVLFWMQSDVETGLDVNMPNGVSDFLYHFFWRHKEDLATVALGGSKYQRFNRVYKSYKLLSPSRAVDGTHGISAMNKNQKREVRDRDVLLLTMLNEKKWKRARQKMWKIPKDTVVIHMDMLLKNATVPLSSTAAVASGRGVNVEREWIEQFSELRQFMGRIPDAGSMGIPLHPWVNERITKHMTEMKARLDGYVATRERIIVSALEAHQRRTAMQNRRRQAYVMYIESSWDRPEDILQGAILFRRISQLDQSREFVILYGPDVNPEYIGMFFTFLGIHHLRLSAAHMMKVNNGGLGKVFLWTMIEYERVMFLDINYMLLSDAKKKDAGHDSMSASPARAFMDLWRLCPLQKNGIPVSLCGMRDEQKVMEKHLDAEYGKFINMGLVVVKPSLAVATLMQKHVEEGIAIRFISNDGGDDFVFKFFNMRSSEFQTHPLYGPKYAKFRWAPEIPIRGQEVPAPGLNKDLFVRYTDGLYETSEGIHVKPWFLLTQMEQLQLSTTRSPPSDTVLVHMRGMDTHRMNDTVDQLWMDLVGEFHDYVNSIPEVITQQEIDMLLNEGKNSTNNTIDIAGNITNAVSGNITVANTTVEESYVVNVTAVQDGQTPAEAKPQLTPEEPTAAEAGKLEAEAAAAELERQKKLPFVRMGRQALLGKLRKVLENYKDTREKYRQTAMQDAVDYERIRKLAEAGDFKSLKNEISLD
eukprot:Nk52_evm9s533 gene=Nk52_evmTU9s533